MTQVRRVGKGGRGVGSFGEEIISAVPTLIANDVRVGTADRVNASHEYQGRLCPPYRFSHRRAKPSNPCGRKITMAMKMMPSGIR